MRPKTGSIYQTRNGRFCVRLTTPSGDRRPLGIFDTREEAERERDAALEILTNEDHDNAWTVATWGDRYLNARDVTKAVSDPESDWSRWRKHIAKDPIARIALRALRRRHVKAWLERLRAKGLGRQTIFNCLNILGGMLRSAIEDEILKSNVTAGIRRTVPKEKRTEEPWTWASLEEQWAIVLATPGDEKWIVGFAIGSGLRAGELVALRLSDVHVDGDAPHVVVRYGGAPNEPTKGGRIRHVPLFGLGLESAKRWSDALPSWLEQKGTGKRAVRNPHGLMFPRLRGGFRDHLHVFRWDAWQATLTRAGILRDFRWHDLRHTCGSALVSGLWGRAWTLIEVRDFLGHESIATTERYAHLCGTALQRAAAETRLAISSEGGAIGFNRLHRPAARVENHEGSRLVSPARLERATLGLGRPWNNRAAPEEFGGDRRLVAISLAFLRAMATGDEDAATALRAQLGALYVEDARRAIELAEAIVAAAAPVAKADAS